MAEISAHKGGSERAEPATYEAYEHVLTSGAEYAEFDIRRTGDGTLVVHHDTRPGPGQREQLAAPDTCPAATGVPRPDPPCERRARLLSSACGHVVGRVHQVQPALI